MKRTSSGVERSRIEVRIVLMQPDLPEPVVPAIRMCGMRARSVQTAAPEISLPSQTLPGLRVRPGARARAPERSALGQLVVRGCRRRRLEERLLRVLVGLIDDVVAGE